MPTLYDELAAHQKNKQDKRVFGLVLQGGGMRAVYTAGASATLIEYGFTNAFDHIVGSSAGAINGTYFLGGDKEMLHTYSDDLTTKNFVSLARPGKIVDIDYMVDTILKHKRPINIQKLLQATTKLHIVLTDAKNGRKVILSDHQQFADIYEEFRATAALPILYDNEVKVGDKWYIDGGVADLLPVDVAIKLGCTDIVVAMSQQIANYHFDKRHGRLEKRLVHHFARNKPEAVKKILPTNEKLLQVNLRRLTKPGKKIRIYVLQPSNADMLFSLGTVDKPKVEALAELGITDMDAFLHKPLMV